MQNNFNNEEPNNMFFGIQWYYIQNNVQNGPINLDKLKELIRSGVITKETNVWKKGMPNWLPVGQLSELASFFINNPPPAKSTNGPPPLTQTVNLNTAIPPLENKTISSTSALQREYLIYRQILALAGANFRVYDHNNKLIAFSHQKAFKLKEDIRVYTDESKSEELFYIKARNIIDFSAAYDVFESKTNEYLGTWKRKGFSSFIRDNWTLESKKFNAELKEDSVWLALFRRFIFRFLPQDYHLLIGGTEAVLYSQNINPFVYKLNVNIHTVLSEHFTNLFLAGGILLAAIEGKQ